MKNSFNTIWYYDKRGLPTHNPKKGIMMHYGFEDGSFVLIPKNADGTYPDPPDKMPTEDDDTDDDYSEVSATGWSEDDHPRGQPQNPGQFVKKGEGATALKRDRRKTKGLPRDKYGDVIMPDGGWLTYAGTVDQLRKNARKMFDHQRYKIDIVTDPDMSKVEVQRMQAKMEVLAKVINEVPDHYVEPVRSITIGHERDGENWGSWNDRTDHLYFNMAFSSNYSTENMRALVHHELAHARFSTWPLEKKKEWAAAVGRDKMPPINAYVGSWVNFSDERQAAEEAAEPGTYAAKLKPTADLAHYEKYLKTGVNESRFSDVNIDRMLDNAAEYYGMTRKDIKNGKLRKKIEGLSFERGHRYANEQHSALMESIWGHKKAKTHKAWHDDETFKRVWKIWRDRRFGTTG